MSLSTLVEMDWLFTAMSADCLKRAASSICVWQQVMQTPLLRLHELLEEKGYALHDVDVNVIREPLNFTAIDSSAVYPDTVVAPIGIGSNLDEPAGRIARVKVSSSLPEIWRSDYDPARPDPVAARPASRASSGSDDEMDRDRPRPLLRAQTSPHDPVQLLVILQRYAERLAHLAQNHKPPLTSADMRVSLNVKMTVENVTASLTQRKKVRPLLVKRRTIGPASNTERAPTFPQPTTLDRFGRRAMRKLEGWVDEGKTSDGPKLKTESPRVGIVNTVVARAVTRKGILSNLERLNDEGRLDEGATVNPSRLALVPRTKNSRVRSINKLSHSHESNDVRDESLLTEARLEEIEKSVVARTRVKAGARPVQDRMAELLQTAGSRLRNESLLEQPMLIHTLERIVEKLVNVETKCVEIVAHARLDVEGKETGVEWLNDDDLTAKLQRILKRQARRRGINLS